MIEFARPTLLLLAIFPPLIWLLAYRQRNVIFRLGQPSTINQTLSTHPTLNRWGRICQSVGIVLLAIAAAGPTWGRSTESGVIRGRDLVVVIDLSKSMLTEDILYDGQPLPRWEAQRAAIANLLDEVERRGGHRLAFVVFAAEPWVLAPLTTDYDFLRLKLDELDPQFPPAEVLPREEDEFISGTRIGKALKLAVDVHDPRFPGYRDILLLSDGDDPDDLKDLPIGIAAVRNASIPVHVIGVGDIRESEIPGLDFTNSKLHEAELKQLAIDCDGEFASWPGEIPRLGGFFRSRLENRPSRILDEGLLPRPTERFVWFLLPALGMIVIGSWLESRRRAID